MQIENREFDTKDIDEVRHALRSSLPIFFAHFPLGIVFGILFFQLDYPWYYAPIMSALVFAGAVQFIALGILTIHGSYIELMLATCFVALRNAFYGLSLTERFATTPLKKLYLIFGLVDGTYAILINTPKLKNDTSFCLILTFLNHLYWVSGTLIGAYYAKWLPDISGMEFVLTAFFVVLVIEQTISMKSIRPFIIAGVSTAIALVITPQHLLLSALLLSATFILTLPLPEASSDGK